MVYYPLHQRLVVEGTIAGGDVWSFGLNTIWGGLPGLQMSFEDQEAILNTEPIGAQVGLASVIADWWGGTQGSWDTPASVFSLVAVKFNSIGHDGKYVFPDTSEHQYASPIVGGYSVGRSPRDSLCVTLRASYERGRGSKGRFYPPAMGAALPAAGSAYVDPSTANTYLTAMKSLLDTINTAAISGSALQVVNISPGTDSLSSITAPVTRIEVDRVVDTQRRRTNRIPRQTVAADLA